MVTVLVALTENLSVVPETEPVTTAPGDLHSPTQKSMCTQLKVKSWAVVAHAFNPSTQEEESGGAL